MRTNHAIVGDWVHMFGAGTVFNMRGGYSEFLEWSYPSRRSGSTRRAALHSRPADAQQADRRDLSDHHDGRLRQLSRGRLRTSRNYALQPNVSMNRGDHNIRSGLDIRSTKVFNENDNNSGGLMQFNRTFTAARSAARACSGNSFASFLLGAPSGGAGRCQPQVPLPVDLRGAVGAGRLADHQQADAERGFRWDFTSPLSEAHDRLNYIFDPTIVNPVSAAVGRTVMGGLTFVNVGGAPDRPWYDKNNYQFRGGIAYRSARRPCCAAATGSYFLNPTEPDGNTGFAFRRRSSRRTTETGRRSTTWTIPSRWACSSPRVARSAR